MSQSLPEKSGEERGAAEGTGARERLLQAAAELIIERESVDISLADIAARAGLNAALVKYYFGAKTGLLKALIKRDASVALRQMNELLAMPIAPAQKMRLHLRGIMNAYRRSPYLNRLLAYMLTDADADSSREIHDDFVRPVQNCQQRILQEGSAAGVFRPVDPILFYLGAIGACDQFMHGERMFRLATGTAPDAGFAERYMHHVEDMVLASLVPGVPASAPPPMA